MSTDTLDILASKFGLLSQTVYSWYESEKFHDEESGTRFFSESKSWIHAKPFVKWVGGKRQLMEQFRELFPNPTEYGDYFEPFLWGGAVFFNLQKKKSYLSDMNEELINVYRVVKNNPESLLNFLKNIAHSQETYLDIRAWDRVPNWQNHTSDVERAGRFLYLNRTCFNGLHRVNSKGEFNVPMGRYKNPDFVQEDNIRWASRLLNETEAEIRVESFEHVLDEGKAKKGDFVYFDPPYDTLSETANFTSYNKDSFGRDMQRVLAETFRELDRRGCKVMLSNHNTPYIRELYDGFRFEIVKARRNVNSKSEGRGEVEEIVVLNY